jgi:hypothetical protein
MCGYEIVCEQNWGMLGACMCRCTCGGIHWRCRCGLCCVIQLKRVRVDSGAGIHLLVASLLHVLVAHGPRRVVRKPRGDCFRSCLWPASRLRGSSQPRAATAQSRFWPVCGFQWQPQRQGVCGCVEAVGYLVTGARPGMSARHDGSFVIFCEKWCSCCGKLEGMLAQD